MVMIANYQYGWTFFVPDIQKTFGWDRASIQWAFTLFVLFVAVSLIFALVLLVLPEKWSRKIIKIAFCIGPKDR